MGSENLEIYRIKLMTSNSFLKDLSLIIIMYPLHLLQVLIKHNAFTSLRPNDVNDHVCHEVCAFTNENTNVIGWWHFFLNVKKMKKCIAVK